MVDSDSDESDEYGGMSFLPGIEKTQADNCSKKRSPSTVSVAAAVADPSAKKAKGRPPGAKNKTHLQGKPQKPQKTKNQKTSNPRFVSAEDVILCKAYKSVSEDPIKGCNQKIEDFWLAIKQKYDMLLDDEDVIKALPRNRTVNAIRTRWERHIKVEMPKYNKHYKACKTPLQSGWTEEMYRNVAKDCFLEEYGYKFKFLECCDILWEMPKFDPMVDQEAEVEIVDGNEDDNSETAEDGGTQGGGGHNKVGGRIMGSANTRPVGNKTAKRLQQAQEKNSRLDLLRIKVVKNLGASIGDPTRQLAEVIEKSALNEQRLTLIGQFIAMGQHDKAAALSQKMEYELFGKTAMCASNSPSRVRAQQQDVALDSEIYTVARMPLNQDDDDEDDDDNDVAIALTRLGKTTNANGYGESSESVNEEEESEEDDD
jgi:hypothetical protein